MTPRLLAVAALLIAASLPASSAGPEGWAAGAERTFHRPVGSFPVSRQAASRAAFKNVKAGPIAVTEDEKGRAGTLDETQIERLRGHVWKYGADYPTDSGSNDRCVGRGRVPGKSSFEAEACLDVRDPDSHETGVRVRAAVLRFTIGDLTVTAARWEKLGDELYRVTRRVYTISVLGAVRSIEEKVLHADEDRNTLQEISRGKRALSEPEIQEQWSELSDLIPTYLPQTQI